MSGCGFLVPDAWALRAVRGFWPNRPQPTDSKGRTGSEPVGPGWLGRGGLRAYGARFPAFRAASCSVRCLIGDTYAGWLESLRGTAQRRLEGELFFLDFAPRAAAELQRRRAERPHTEPADRREQYDRRELFEKAYGHAAARLLMRCRLAPIKARTAGQKETPRARLDELAAKPRAAKAFTLFLAEGYGVVAGS